MLKKISAATLLFFTLCFINSACKKSDAPTSTSGTPSTNNNVSSSGDPSGTFSGYFYEDVNPGNSQAAFYTTPITFQLSKGSLPTPTGTVQAVYCNNAKFGYDSAIVNYYDTATIASYPPATWSVTGGTNFPSFTYTCTTTLPTYNNNASLPSVINRNQNLTIPISGVANYDQIIINISDYGTFNTTMTASSSATSITFIKDSLAKINPSNLGTIYVQLYKYNPQTIGGKNYLFITSINYSKNNVVIQ